MESLSLAEGAASLPELLQRRVMASPDTPALFSRSPAGTWQSMTWRDIWTAALRAADVMRNHGLQRGDPVAILARTRREWMLADHAVMLSGFMVVGVDTHAPEAHIEHVLRHSGAKALIADTPKSLEKVSPETRKALCLTVIMEAAETAADVMAWSEFTGSGTIDVSAAAVFPAADAAATLIYTSGTTGTPKAIAYTHAHLMAACRAIVRLFPEADSQDRTVCWLPMSHLFQRMINLTALAKGSPIFFVDDPRTMMVRLREIKPAVLIGVPRFFEKVREGFMEKTRALRWLPATIQRPMLAALAKRMFGGRIKFLITGSAPCPTEVHAFFEETGLPLFEAYGISENAIPMAANRFGAWRRGTVGHILEENHVRFGNDSEILVKGPGVFNGYYRDRETHACFTDDGYYRTGDYGLLDEDGYLHLQGRKSDLIKTSTGRRISPAKIEALLQASPCLEHAVVVGSGRKHLAALLTLDRAWLARQTGCAPDAVSLQAWQEAEAAHRELLETIEAINNNLPPYERLRSFSILPSSFSMETGDLTPTLKVKRRAVQQKYGSLIEKLYSWT